jgi:hypothetical protein
MWRLPPYCPYGLQGYLAHENRPPRICHHRALGTCLLKGLGGRHFVMGEFLGLNDKTQLVRYILIHIYIYTYM